MRVQVCDSDEGGNACQKNVDYGCSVRQYFSSQKAGANIKDYTVLINSRPADAETIISEGCQLVINKKKMVGATVECMLRHINGLAGTRTSKDEVFAEITAAALAGLAALRAGRLW